MLSVLIPSWAIWRQRKSWISPYVFHLLVAIWATVLMGFVDAALTAAEINWPSTWAGPKSWTVSSRDSALVKGTTTRINAHPGDGMTATFAVGFPQ
ncbi:hypothetical protein, partial [Deinococcus xinjiangensis]|uniref:hypothetical protein n=1 Tax=Deinococcus xinjiangensis TaxID=457454 RepID=UPI00336534CD